MVDSPVGIIWRSRLCPGQRVLALGLQRPIIPSGTSRNPIGAVKEAVGCEPLHRPERDADASDLFFAGQVDMDLVVARRRALGVVGEDVDGAKAGDLQHSQQLVWQIEA